MNLIKLIEASKESIEIENKKFKSENNLDAKTKYFQNKNFHKLSNEKDPEKRRKLIIAMLKNKNVRGKGLMKFLSGAGKVNPLTKITREFEKIYHRISL